MNIHTSQALHLEREHPANQADLATVQSVDRALAIVEYLMRTGESLPARQIALRIGINRTTAHRLLNALMHRGWIEKAPGSSRYRIALRHLVIANLAYQQRDVMQALRPTLEALSTLSRETVHVGVLDGVELVHVDKVDSPENIGVSSSVGTRVLPHPTSLGKALLAASDSRTVAACVDHARRFAHPDTPVDESRLRIDLEETRQRGYSVDNEESSPGVRCIGAAIMAGTGEPIFAISITGPAGRFTLERAHACAPALTRAATTLSREFGWTDTGQDQQQETRIDSGTEKGEVGTCV